MRIVRTALGEQFKLDRERERLRQVAIARKLATDTEWDGPKNIKMWLSLLERGGRHREVSPAQRKCLARALGRREEAYLELPLHGPATGSFLKVREIVDQVDASTMVRVISPFDGPASLRDTRALAALYELVFIKRVILEIYSKEPAQGGCPKTLCFLGLLLIIAHNTESENSSGIEDFCKDLLEFKNRYTLRASDEDFLLLERGVQVYQFRDEPGAKPESDYNPFTYVHVSQPPFAFAVSDASDVSIVNDRTLMRVFCRERDTVPYGHKEISQALEFYVERQKQSRKP